MKHTITIKSLSPVFPLLSDVSVPLRAAQSRCSLLEKQLDYMRKMVLKAEMEKKLVLEQQVHKFNKSFLTFVSPCGILMLVFLM